MSISKTCLSLAVAALAGVSVSSLVAACSSTSSPSQGDAGVDAGKDAMVTGDAAKDVMVTGDAAKDVMVTGDAAKDAMVTGDAANDAVVTGDGGGCEDVATVLGPVNGVTMPTPTYSVVVPVGGDGGPSGFFIGINDNGDLCPDLRDGGIAIELEDTVSVFMATPQMLGTFPVTLSGTEARANFHQTPLGSCKFAVSTNAESGSITISAISSSTVSGCYDLHYPLDGGGGTFSGSFSAPICTGVPTTGSHGCYFP
jgi:hypothetical protein